MDRSGALTLGAVLMLGGVTGAWGEDLSGVVGATSNAAILPSWGGVFPRIPENWSDLPFQLKLFQTLEYNDNVLGLSTNMRAAAGLTRGDFESLSSFGAATKAYWEGQQFFADGSLGLTRYLHDVTLNTVQNFARAGVNWIYTSRCSGTLVASESVAPQPFTQQIVSTAVNTVTLLGFNETATCHVSRDYDANFNSGVTETTNSTLANKLNDSRSEFIAAGITYNVTATNNLQVLATITGTDYTHRSAALNALGLANAITQDQVNVTYTRQINPNLSVTASIGATGVKNSSFTFALPSKIEPLYSATAIWAATPKVTVTASAARTVGIPQSVIGNAQITESASLGLSYHFSPKVSFTAGASSAFATSAFSQPAGAQAAAAILNGVPASILTSQKSYGASAGLTYNMTPFLVANLNYQYSRSVQGGLVTPQNVVLLNLNYSPY
jgi:hypothetical protein